LLTYCRGLEAEAVAVSADAEESYEYRAILSDLCGELFAPGDEFGRVELVGRRGGAVDEVGDAVAVLEELALLGGMEQARAEAGGVQGRPEAVAGTGEVMAGGGGVKAGVDADEEDAQAGRDYVPDTLVF
jgi:hypothetical protein